MIKRNSSFAYYLFKFFFSNRSKIHVLFFPFVSLSRETKVRFMYFLYWNITWSTKISIYLHAYIFVYSYHTDNIFEKILMSYNYMSIIKKILRTLNINKLFYEFNLAMHSMILYYFLWSCLLVLARFEGGGGKFCPILKKII